MGDEKTRIEDDKQRTWQTNAGAVVATLDCRVRLQGSNDTTKYSQNGLRHCKSRTGQAYIECWWRTCDLAGKVSIYKD